MFCKFCGAWLQVSYKLCPKCAAKVDYDRDSQTHSLQSNSVAKKPSLQSPQPCSFRQFVSKKSEELQALSYRPKSKKRKQTEDEDVMINIGLMQKKSDGKTEILRGKRLPLKVSQNASSQEVLDAALKKRQAHDRSFRIDRCYSLA